VRANCIDETAAERVLTVWDGPKLASVSVIVARVFRLLLLQLELALDLFYLVLDPKRVALWFKSPKELAEVLGISPLKHVRTLANGHFCRTALASVEKFDIIIITTTFE